MKMYLQQHVQPPVFRLKYFTSDSPNTKDKELSHEEDGENIKSQHSDAKKKTKSFLDPNEQTFAAIRQRLSTLSLNTEYKSSENQIVPPPFQRDRMRLPPKRISSISSRDTSEKFSDNHSVGGARIHSRASFQSDDREYRSSRRSKHLTRHRASETATLNKLNDNILTPGQNPELFSRQIKLSGEKANRFHAKSVKSRSTSPKSVRSVDSTGKVHLGLIESLDLNEKLNDVEKIKERYSNDTFIHSLAMYKLRGHDKCLRQTGMTEYIPRGTKLSTSDESRCGSKLLMDCMNSIPNVASPRFGGTTRPLFLSSTKWEPDKKYFLNQIESDARGSANGRKQSLKSKKSVGFAAGHQELSEDELQDRAQPLSARDSPLKEPKSILKRSGSRSTNRDSLNNDINNEDEFMVDENFRWKYQLPKIHSPKQSFRTRPSLSFRRKMYHFGDGVSSEFDQVIAKYGNCRQSSWVKEHSYVRDPH